MAHHFRTGSLVGLTALVVACAPAAPVGTAGTVVHPISVAGRVLGLDGRPAPGVRVQAFLVSDGASNLIANNGSAIIGDGGASLIGKTKYRLASAEANIEVRTDADGRFQLTSVDGSALNVEAVYSDEIKAMQQAATGDGLTLQLAYTGAIDGQVRVPDAPGVTDLTGVDVYVPGTGYLAKTDAAGHFHLAGMAVGSYTLVGDKPGLGTGRLEGVGVASRQATAAPDLVLRPALAHIAAIAPPNAGPGATVTLRGDRFGASTGAPFQVVFGGAVATVAHRLDDRNIAAVVPAAAATGDVQVFVNDVPGDTAPFSVIANISIAAGLRDLLVGTRQPLLAVVTDTNGDRIAAPALTWQAADATVDVDASGTVTPHAAGATRVTASSGRVSDHAAIRGVAQAPVLTNWLGTGQDLAGSGLQANLLYPADVAIAPDGRLAVADAGHNRILRVTPEGAVDVLAGDGAMGYLDGPGTTAQFSFPTGLAYDAAGNLYVADQNNWKLRKIAPDGTVSTVAAGDLDAPSGVAVDGQGTVYVTDTEHHRVMRVAPGGAVTVLAGGVAGYADGPGAAARFQKPTGIAVDGHGTIYLADPDDHRIRRITPEGMVSTVAGDGTAGFVDGPGASARFDQPDGVAVDPDGNLLVSDTHNERIRLITPQGQVSTLAGTGDSGLGTGSALQAALAYPSGLVCDAAGHAYIAEIGNNRVSRLQRK